MNKKLLFSIIILTLVFLPACGNKNATPTKKVEITISAAASLNDSLKEIKSNFEKNNHQITVLYNLGGSGTLKQQILQGAPTDFFISAAKNHFDELVQKGLIDKENYTDLLNNNLVLITNKSKPASIQTFADLTKSKITKIAIGTPETVPAGQYAKQTLQNLHIWESLQPKLVLTKDVRQVLTYVETGDVDAGLVYMTDAKISDKVKVALVSEENSHDPIVYSAGIINSTLHKKEATLFFKYLKSKPARDIFEKYGFTVLD